MHAYLLCQNFTKIFTSLCKSVKTLTCSRKFHKKSARREVFAHFFSPDRGDCRSRNKLKNGLQNSALTQPRKSLSEFADAYMCHPPRSLDYKFRSRPPYHFPSGCSQGSDETLNHAFCLAYLPPREAHVQRRRAIIHLLGHAFFSGCVRRPGLKGSIGEGSNFSHQSSVKILSKLNAFC